MIAFVVTLLLAAVFSGDMRTRAYLRLHTQELEAPSSDGVLQYGQWDTFCYPEKGMVEFLTGKLFPAVVI